MPSLSLRWPARAVAAPLIACLAGLGGAIPALSQSARHPLSPSQARSEITTYFNRIYYGLIDVGTMHVQTETVRPGRLVITGACESSNLYIMRIDDSEANGQTLVECQRDKRTGHHLGEHTPRHLMPYFSQQHVTYQPLLTSLGERAATSVSVPDSEHGTATYAFDSKTDLDITYGRDPAATGTRQLEQLRLHVGHGHESVREIWYG